jgi:hypothetical protein
MPSDEPMAGKTKLWAGWPDNLMEYRLGNIIRFPKEDLIVELTIEEPDEILAKANPRLKIIGDYDPAAFGYVYIFRLVQYIFLLLCLCAAFYLSTLSWRYVKLTKK